MNDEKKSAEPTKEQISAIREAYPEIAEATNKIFGSGKKLRPIDFDGTVHGFRVSTQAMPLPETLLQFRKGLENDPNCISFVLSGRTERDLKMLFEPLIEAANKENKPLTNLVLCPENGRLILIPSQEAEGGYIRMVIIPELSEETKENLYKIAVDVAEQAAGELVIIKLDSGNIQLNDKVGDTIIMYEPKPNGASMHTNRSEKGRNIAGPLRERVILEKNLGNLSGIETIEQADGALAVEQTKGGKKVFAEIILEPESDNLKFLADYGIHALDVWKFLADNGIKVSNPQMLEGMGDDEGDQIFLNYLIETADKFGIPCLALGVCNHSKLNPIGRLPGNPFRPIASPLFLADGEGHCLDLLVNKEKRQNLLIQQEVLRELNLLPETGGERKIPLTVLDTGDSMTIMIQNPQAYDLSQLKPSTSLGFQLILSANAGVVDNLKELIKIGEKNPKVLIADKNTGEIYQNGNRVVEAKEYENARVEIIASSTDPKKQHEVKEAKESLVFTHAVHMVLQNKGLIEKNPALDDPNSLRCPAAFYHEHMKKQKLAKAYDATKPKEVQFGVPQTKRTTSASSGVSDSKKPKTGTKVKLPL